MISIDQLLESVDLDFEPRFVTKDGNGDVYIFEDVPETYEQSKQWVTTVPASGLAGYEGLKLAEFEGNYWTECIYEVPTKPEITKIEQFTREDFELIPDGSGNYKKVLGTSVLYKLNTLVDAVNELKAKGE